MKGIVLKSLALVILIAFGFMLVPQQADAQINWECLLAVIVCEVATKVAEIVCDNAPKSCVAATLVAQILCGIVPEVC